MNFRTMIQAGPVRANELFGKLAETSDAAVRNRGKLFAELKGELEQHMRMEQDHLLPILRKSAATKDLAGEAVKDNRELRSRLVELESLPKNDAAFPNRLAELRKAFRQHARNDRKELLPVVQQALKADAPQESRPEGAPSAHQPEHGQASPPGGIEPSLAAAAQAKQHEVEQRQAEATARERANPSAGDPARPESSLAAAVQAKQNEAEQRQAEMARQQAERRLAGGAGPAPAAMENANGPVARESNLAAAVLAKQNEAVQQAEQQARQRTEQERQAALAASQEQVRQRLELAEREAAAERLRQAAIRPAAGVAAAAGEDGRRLAGTMAEGMAQVGTTLREAGQSTLDAMRRGTPDLRTVMAVPGMAELGTAWFGFLGRQAAANTRLTRDLAERQRQFAASAWRSLLETNQQAIGITLGVARQGLTRSDAPPRDGDGPARPGSARGVGQSPAVQFGHR